MAAAAADGQAAARSVPAVGELPTDPDIVQGAAVYALRRRKPQVAPGRGAAAGR